MIYEWDPVKATDNKRNHGVSFDEAKTVFRSPKRSTTLTTRLTNVGSSRSERRQSSGFYSSLTRIPAKIGSASSVRVEQRAVKHMPIKSAIPSNSDDLRSEYDLSKLTGGVRGKYYERATAGTTLVLLDRDVAEAFPDGRTVNDALRALIKVAQAKVRAPRSGALADTALKPTSRTRKPRLKPKTRPRAARG